MFNRPLILLAPLLLAGCQAPSPGGPASQPAGTTASPRERGGDFALVDFSNPSLARQFHVTDAARVELAAPVFVSADPRTQRRPHLQAELDHVGDLLSLPLTAGSEFNVIRDWRPYTRLELGLVVIPRAGQVEIGLNSAGAEAIVWQPLTMAADSRTASIDLLDLADAVDLSQVGGVHVRVANENHAVQIELDRLALIDDAHWLVGPASATGEFYVQRRGRHIVVGAVDRFELSFRHGQIARWTGAGGVNLAAQGGLGPWPVPLAETWSSAHGLVSGHDNPQLFADWGAQVLTREECVEATKFRAVIHGEWHYRNAQPAPTSSPAGPHHSWTYVVYPDGDVYVRTESDAPADGWRETRMGYVVAVDDRVGFALRSEARSGAGSPPFAALIRTGAANADLFWTVHQPPSNWNLREQATADGTRAALTIGDWSATAHVDVAHRLRLWSGDLEGLAVMRAFAGQYQQPPAVRIQRGHQFTAEAGDLNHDGFNESEGCLELALENGALSAVIDPGAWPRTGLVARVRGTENQTCWTYQDGRLLTATGRDAQQRLLVRLNHFDGARTTFEAMVQQR